jgi:hypothetical protein
LKNGRPQKIGCIEEVAYRMDFIDRGRLEQLAATADQKRLWKVPAFPARRIRFSSVRHLESFNGKNIRSTHDLFCQFRKKVLICCHEMPCSLMQFQEGKAGIFLRPYPSIPPQMKRKILVTGGAGFIGSILAERLCQKYGEFCVLSLTTC